MTDEARWKNDDDALQCPVCRKGKRVDGSGVSNGHIVGGWVDNLDQRASYERGRPLTIGPSALPDYGPGVGVELSFEHCDHRIAYRLRFHKGDVYLEWLELEAHAPGQNPAGPGPRLA